MALITLPISYSFRDAKGWVSRTRYYMTGDDASVTLTEDLFGLAQTLRVALEALTNASLQSTSGLDGTTQAQPVAYGTNAEYPASWMHALMTWDDGFGSIHRFKVPAPKLAIFDTDGITVLNDGTQDDVADYVEAVKTVSNTVFFSSRSGVALTNFIGGIFVGGRQPRRFNEFIKSSHLVQGEGE